MKLIVEVSEVLAPKGYGTEGKQLQEFVGVYKDNGYESSVMFTAFGSNVDAVGSLRVGETAEVDFSVRSRKWEANGKSGWNTSLTVNSIEIQQQKAKAPQPVQQEIFPDATTQGMKGVAYADAQVDTGEVDDLPFN